MCAAPKGNKFWELRATHGRGKVFTDPEELWKLTCGYFEWASKNTLKEEKVFGTGKRMKVNHPRAFTLRALCFYLGITEQSWNNYHKAELFSDIIEAINQVIYTQKFEGAAAGFFNANIIARDLGLKDATDVTTDGKSLTDAFSSTIGKVRKKIKESGLNE